MGGALGFEEAGFVFYVGWVGDNLGVAIGYHGFIEHARLGAVEPDVAKKPVVFVSFGDVFFEPDCAVCWSK